MSSSPGSSHSAVKPFKGTHFLARECNTRIVLVFSHVFQTLIFMAHMSIIGKLCLNAHRNAAAELGSNENFNNDILQSQTEAYETRWATK